MPLSRLENFLKNVEGNILYVNPTDLDATDSIENQGNSLTKSFKTIQRDSARDLLDSPIKLDRITINLIERRFYYILVLTKLITDQVLM